MLKKKLRKLLKKKRSDISQSMLLRKSLKIFGVLFNNKFFDISSFINIHTYLSTKYEIDTHFIVEILLRDYYTTNNIIVPKIHMKTLDHYYLTRDTRFHINKYGILEPRNTEKKCNIDDLCNDNTCIIIPTLGLTKDGHRLGYGCGHYDRFLSKCPNSVKIGLCLEQFIEIDDINNFDIKMDYGILPDKNGEFNIYKF